MPGPLSCKRLATALILSCLAAGPALADGSASPGSAAYWGMGVIILVICLFTGISVFAILRLSLIHI